MGKKVSITGHTKGIGLAIANYFLNNGYLVTGFSKSNGYDITNTSIRQQIVKESNDAVIFVNNAYNNFDNSQLEILENIYKDWEGQDKIIINISSRFTNGDNDYSQSKQKLDQFCEQKIYNRLPYLINLKPGLTNTLRVESIEGNRMEVNDVVNVLDYILSHKKNIRFTTISFGK